MQEQWTLTPEGRKNLINELRNLAKSVPSSRHFWEYFVDGLEAGKAPSLNLKTHYKAPRDLKDIALEIHEVIFPGKTKDSMTDELFATYLKLIGVVKRGLDY